MGFGNAGNFFHEVLNVLCRFFSLSAQRGKGDRPIFSVSAGSKQIVSTLLGPVTQKAVPQTQVHVQLCRGSGTPIKVLPE
jgi:hypothetical protein